MTDINAEEAPLFGNEACVAFLEKCLAHAKKGTVSHVALAMVDGPDRIIHESVGIVATQTEINAALDMLKAKIDRQCADRLAPYDPTKPANDVCFNVANGVMSFDFLAWLIGAEMARRRAGVPEPLRVGFFKAKTQTTASDYHTQMLQNVMGPMLSMVGAVHSQEAIGGRQDFSVTHNEITEFARLGEAVPQIRPTDFAYSATKKMLDGLSPVTITLRESTIYPHRNSNLPAWLKFAKYLESQGEEVVFIRDTAKAEEDLEDHTVFPLASIDLHIRLSLYMQSKFNCFVGNGPAVLNWHIDQPFFMLAESDPTHKKAYATCWPEVWERQMGITQNEQFPWFNEGQRIIWKPDTYENLVEAWETRRV